MPARLLFVRCAEIAEFKPTDATTNPSLVLKAALMPEYEHLVDEAITYAKANATTPEAQLDLASDKVVSTRANPSISAMRPPCYSLLEEIVILG